MLTSISIQAIKILERHADFVLEHYERYTSEEQMKPAELEEIFSDEWTREQLGRVSHKGAKHLSRVRFNSNTTQYLLTRTP